MLNCNKNDHICKITLTICSNTYHPSVT